ncbi:PspC domain-containing protein [Goodfellowiella coeruleoviolacea]|uniref:PspC domain-containing protein n=1 Tax=Goodfellowiella coeruleoviolacea TaxID=334858 RepID=UPI0020A2ABF7|nr:PspC domain-containing protein [Goodfellowiella coeruleoviolacea]
MSGKNRGEHTVQDTARDFWATRPRRTRRGRKIAGVAAGIGQRYAIDPVIVRVGFVIATLYGGVGVVLYLLGWLLLPDETDEVSPAEGLLGRGRSGMSTLFTLALCAMLFPALGFLFTAGFLPLNGILSVLVALGVLYLLHRNRGQLAAAATSTTSTTTASGADAAGTGPQPADRPGGVAATTTGTAPDAADAATTPVPGPPAWDPLGAAPFAWDLPEPTPQPTEQPAETRRRPRVGVFTLGAVLVVGGALASVSPLLGGWLSPEHVIGVLLSVVGLGMVGGAFLRTGRGLIWLAAPLAVAGLVLAHSHDDDGPRWSGAGDLKLTPAAIANVDSVYRRSVGDIQLDLRQLPAEGTVHTRAITDVGDVEIWVPENADVEVTCASSLGDVSCLNNAQDGVDASVRVDDVGPDGPGGLKIVLEARTSTGSVEVRRDN